MSEKIKPAIMNGNVPIYGMSRVIKAKQREYEQSLLEASLRRVGWTMKDVEARYRI